MKVGDNIGREFPIARKVIYLNTAGVGLIPRTVVDAISVFYRRTLAVPPYRELFEEYAQMVEQARGEFGRTIAASADEVSFQPNTSASTNTVVQMMGWKKGDNAVIDDLGFPSDTYPLLALRDRGVDIRVLKSKGGYAEAEDYGKVVDRRTKLVMLSLVSWINGMRSRRWGNLEDCQGEGSLGHG